MLKLNLKMGGGNVQVTPNRALTPILTLTPTLTLTLTPSLIQALALVLALILALAPTLTLTLPTLQMASPDDQAQPLQQGQRRRGMGLALMQDRPTMV